MFPGEPTCDHSPHFDTFSFGRAQYQDYEIHGHHFVGFARGASSRTYETDVRYTRSGVPKCLCTTAGNIYVALLLAECFRQFIPLQGPGSASPNGD